MRVGDEMVVILSKVENVIKLNCQSLILFLAIDDKLVREINIRGKIKLEDRIVPYSLKIEYLLKYYEL